MYYTILPKVNIFFKANRVNLLLFNCGIKWKNDENTFYQNKRMRNYLTYFIS